MVRRRWDVWMAVIVSGILIFAMYLGDRYTLEECRTLEYIFFLSENSTAFDLFSYVSFAGIVWLPGLFFCQHFKFNYSSGQIYLLTRSGKRRWFLMTALQLLRNVAILVGAQIVFCIIGDFALHRELQISFALLYQGVIFIVALFLRLLFLNILSMHYPVTYGILFDLLLVSVQIAGIGVLKGGIPFIPLAGMAVNIQRNMINQNTLWIWAAAALLEIAVMVYALYQMCKRKELI